MSIRGRRTVVACSFVALVLVGCDGLWLDTYWRNDRYVLVAVDARGQMHLAFDLGKGTSLGLVGPTVFAIGADEKHIVLKQHPSSDSFGASADRSTTRYFIVTKTTSPEFEQRQKGVRGPLTQKEFEALTTALSLPPFKKTFADLE